MKKKSQNCLILKKIETTEVSNKKKKMKNYAIFKKARIREIFNKIENY